MIGRRRKLRSKKMNAPPDRSAWLKGGNACCLNPPEPPAGLPWRLVLLGAPGVGKGSQADLLCERLGACHLSTGDVFRAAGSSAPEGRSPALKAALEYMHRGALVPDTTVLDMVAERKRCLRCAGGFVLDGFPRTVAQAEALELLLEDQGVGLDAVFDYQLPIGEIVARLSGRRVCPACKAIYHLTGKPPRKPGICDACGGPLRQRDDDRPEAVQTRMRAYEETIAPLLDFYRSRGSLIIVPANGTPEEVYARAWALAVAVRPGLDVPLKNRPGAAGGNP
jgi:adenylate kinase